MSKFTTWLRKIFAAEPQQTPTKKPTAPIKREPYVYVTAKGKRFHWDQNCPAGDVKKMDLSAAKAAGLTPCSRCCAVLKGKI